MMAWLLQTVAAWGIMSVCVWVVSRHLAAREVERVRREYEWMRQRVRRRRVELDRALSEPARLERAQYVMMVNELMFIAQLEHRWDHGAQESEP